MMSALAMNHHRAVTATLRLAYARTMSHARVCHRAVDLAASMRSTSARRGKRRSSRGSCRKQRARHGALSIYALAHRALYGIIWRISDGMRCITCAYDIGVARNSIMRKQHQSRRRHNVAYGSVSINGKRSGILSIVSAGVISEK